MREHLIQYVDLLFAGAAGTDEIKQEILQNTLDRYDDLISQGKAPEAAYRLAISGIGDISEILHSTQDAPQSESTSRYPAGSSAVTPDRMPPLWKKGLRAVAICLYILCPTPLFVLSELNMATLGLCGTLAIVAVATALIVISGSSKPEPRQEAETVASTPRQELRKAVNTVIFTVGLCIYLLISFATQAWWITWLMFPLIGAVQGLARACMDLMEASNHEN